MSRLMLFLLFFYQSQGYGDELQGSVDVGSEMASMFQDFINYYLQNSSVGQAGIFIGKLMKEFQISPVDDSPLGGKPEDSDENEDLTVRRESFKKEINNGKKRKPLERENHSLMKSDEDDSEEAFENENDKSETPNRDGTEEDIVTEEDTKKGTRNEYDSDSEKTKNSDEDYDRDESYETSNEAKTAKRDNREERKENLKKEKTFLEEIIGAEENVHVYGSHNDNTNNVPLNNIRT